MIFERLAIVGVGLIGGSFAMAAREAGLARRISGWDDRATLAAALSRGVIDEVEEAFADGGYCHADLIYLAAPVGGIIEFLQTHGRQLKRGAIVTDAGSTKRQVCRTARTALAEGAHFIGGHPMAGSQQRGLSAARADLFRDSAYALIGDEPAQKGLEAIALRLMIEAVRAIGARPVVISAERHDHVVAAISHTPQLLAAALAASVAEAGDELMPQLAGAGFADMTRLAASHWSVWEDICATNGDEIAAALTGLIAMLERMHGELATGNLAQTAATFRSANAFVGGLHEESDEQGNH
ncbi:MAG TPA: prephenate dehydrogenase/arogenate dehydrogenase family protein [Blastocatellia bacterium]|nr:prephenate dehydrogenase/arogenate dehydrogenase family protein [Blastocatellia bacterium]